jgi:hypothetical protein
MMHVIVDNRHALDAERHDGMARGDRYIIEQAKAHRPAWRGVVPRRPYQRKCVVGRPNHYRFNRAPQRQRRSWPPRKSQPCKQVSWSNQPPPRSAAVRTLSIICG